MKKNIFLVLCICTGWPEALPAQEPGLFVRQRSVEIRRTAADSLAAVVHVTPDVVGLRALLPEMPLDELISLAEKRGLDVSTNDSELIFAKDRFRFDMQAPFGRTSMIFHRDSAMVYNVLWPKKLYTAQSVAQRRQVRQSLSGDLDSLIAGLEEARTAADSSADKAHEPAPARHFRLDEELHLHGFVCTRFEKTGAGLEHTVWATRDAPALTRELHRAADRFGDVFRGAARATPEAEFRKAWPDWLPIRTITLRFREHEPAILTIEEILSIRLAPVADSSFAIPEGFRRSSLFDLLNTNMGK